LHQTPGFANGFNDFSGVVFAVFLSCSTCTPVPIM
jgi:hypothetical protein